MSRRRLDILQGTLDMLIMRALATGPKHGWDVLCWLREISAGQIEAEEGAIYPALYRMEERRLIASVWGMSENNRRAKFYRLTAKGARELAARTDAWNRYAEVVAGILGKAGA